MRIAYYGNSFAESGHDISWTKVLARKMNADYSQSFAKGGSSLLYSYQQFLKNYKNFDLNVFVVTHWENYSRELPLMHKDGTTKMFRPNSIHNVEEMIRMNKDILTNTAIETLEYLRGWFIVADDEYMILTWELILKHVESLDPKVVFISSGDLKEKDFMYSDEKRRKQFKRHLSQYHHIQTKSLGMVEPWSYDGKTKLRESPDTMANHLTEETAKIVADSIYSLITTGEMLPAPSRIEHQYTYEHYYLSEDRGYVWSS